MTCDVFAYHATRGQFLRVWTKNAICRKCLRKFSKILKKFHQKLRKMNYFRTFFTKFKKPCVNFLRVWTKNFRNFEKIFLRKLRKCVILAYFSNNLTNHALDILRNFSKFWEIFLKKIAGKCMLLACFSKNLTNYAVIFRAFGRKKQTVGNFEKIF